MRLLLRNRPLRPNMPKLVDDWKQAWRFASVNCMALATAIQGAWMSLDDDMRSQLPKDAIHLATIAILIAGITGRLVRQSPPSDKP